MKKIINKIRTLLWRILGVPKITKELVVYYSDFSDGKLEGKPYQIGYFSVIDYGGGVKIGENAKIGYGVKILSFSTITGSDGEEVIKKQVTIGNNVEIGSNSVILPGVNIGDNSTIGAGAVVLVDTHIPPGSLVVGVPAKIIKKKTKSE